MSQQVQPPHGPSVNATQKILGLLEPLTHTESGASLYKYIEMTLREADAGHRESEEVYAGVVALLLDTVARLLPQNSPLQVQLTLLTARFTPPFTSENLADLRHFLDAHKEVIAQTLQSDNVIAGAFAPLLESFSVAEKKAMATAVTPESGSIESGLSKDAHAAIKAVLQERRAEASYRQYLDRKSQVVQRIQQRLAQHVEMSIANTLAYGTVLENNLKILKDGGAQENKDAAGQENEGADGQDDVANSLSSTSTAARPENQDGGGQEYVEPARAELIGAMEKLVTEQQAAIKSLEEAKNDIGKIGSITQQLDDELTRIQILSLTDDLTGLPNRRALVRRLQEEVSRVQRHGTTLSLALIGIDSFKPGDGRPRQEAIDEILRVISSDILPIFRHHDMAARYGDELFAVLFPNTQIEGAVRALRKAQEQAEKTTFTVGDNSLPLPSLSAGLTRYRLGESTERFLQRTEGTLNRAKERGCTQIEVNQADLEDDRLPAEEDRFPSLV